MLTKTLLVVAIAAMMVSCTDAKYYNVVSWTVWGDGCDDGFAAQCTGAVDKPAAMWLQSVSDHIEIVDFKSYFSQRYGVYSDCWCRTTIYYSTDNITFVQGKYGQPNGSDEAVITNVGKVLLPSITTATIASMFL